MNNANTTATWLQSKHCYNLIAKVRVRKNSINMDLNSIQIGFDDGNANDIPPLENNSDLDSNLDERSSTPNESIEAAAEAANASIPLKSKARSSLRKLRKMEEI